MYAFATAILMAAALGFGREASAQDVYTPPADIPYTAVVSDYSARFVFAIPPRDHWTYGGPAPAQEIEYEWSVEVDNEGRRYRFGVFIEKGPNRVARTSDRPAPLVEGQLRLAEITATGEEIAITRRGGIDFERSTARTANDTKLVIHIYGDALLQRFFYARPAVAQFTERLPGAPPVIRSIPITYDNYTLERSLPPRTPTWVRQYPERTGISVAAAPGGRCLAVADGATAEIRDRTGTVLWSYRKTNRFIGGAIAINPSCDTLVFSGYNGYPYMWIVTRGGRSRYVRISSSPRSVAFDHSGTRLALGSGVGSVYLFTATGRQLWKTDVGSYYVGALEFSDDDRHIIVTEQYGIGVLDISGKTGWVKPETNIVRYSPNLSTFLTFFETMHGPYTPRVATYDGAGKQLWSGDGEGCTVNSGGDKIVVNAGGLKIITPTGEPVASLPSILGCPLAFAGDDTHLVTRKRLAIEAVDLHNQRLWAIPVASHEQYVEPVWNSGHLEGIFLIGPRDDTPGTDRVEWYLLE